MRENLSLSSFLLNLLFRPAIMVITLSLAYIMMGEIVSLFSEYVTGSVIAFIMNSDSWISSLAMLIGAFWVITAFMETAITKCMELVITVPGQVFTWIGGTFGSNVGMGASNEVGSTAQQGLSTNAGQIADAMHKGTGRAKDGFDKLHGKDTEPPKKGPGENSIVNAGGGPTGNPGVIAP